MPRAVYEPPSDLDCDARAVGVGLAVRNGNDAFWTLDLGR